MALNREQKRMLQRKGQLNEDGTPAVTRRTPPTPKPADERTSPRQFVHEVRAELRKVAWPTRAEVVNYTIIVLVTLVLLTVFIGALDWGLGEALLTLFDR
jgi:preprotein translocase subunit SecE